MIDKRIVETKTSQDIVESVTCDLCGQVFRNVQVLSGGIDWNTYTLDSSVQQTGVWIGLRDEYAERRDVDYYQYHICPKCFQEKLEPWLKEQGAQPTKETYVW